MISCSSKMSQILVFLATILFLTSRILTTCPEGAIEGLSSSDCYYFIADPKTWSLAENDCVSRKGHLTSIPDGFHNSFLMQEVTSISNVINETWIGANAFLTPGTWTWSDNTNFTYSNFVKSSPQNSSGLCASFDVYTGKWGIQSCYEIRLSYICKVPPQSGQNVCDSGYIYYPGTKYCYKVIEASGKSFNDTETACQQEGAHLTSIHNEAENTFVLALTYGSNAWIGLHFDAWTAEWTDGSPNDYSNFFGSPSIFGTCTFLCGQHGIPDLYRFWVPDDCTKSQGLAVCKKVPIS